MTQLILDTVYLPQADFDQYACWEEELSDTLEMISGRMVKELRNAGNRYKVWKVRYAYDCMDDETCRAALRILRSGKSFQATALTDMGTMVSSQFHVESITNPTFAFEDDGEAVWHNLAFTLREVSPHA